MTMTFTATHGKPRLPFGRSGARRVVAVAVCALAMLAFSSGAARAATSSPGWSILSVASPTNFIPGDQSGNEHYKVYVTNQGSEPTDGSTVTVTDTLPAGLEVSYVGNVPDFANSPGYIADFDTLDTEVGGPCTTSSSGSSSVVSCTVPWQVPAGDVLELDIYVTVDPSATGPLTNTVSVSGGGAPDASASFQNQVSATPAPFGINAFQFGVTGVDGQPDTQAGSHPYAVSTTLDYNNQLNSADGNNSPIDAGTVQSAKDVVVDLPLGFVGNPQAAPQCPITDLVPVQNFTFPTTWGCPDDTIIGEVTLRVDGDGISTSIGGNGYDGASSGGATVSPIYNLVPEKGYPAEFGFDVGGIGYVHMYASVIHTSSGYELQITSPNLPAPFVQQLGGGTLGYTDGFTLTFFGDPATADGGNNAAAAFYTNPTDCSASGFTATAYVDTWENPGTLNADGTPDLAAGNWYTATQQVPPVTGCNQLSFHPTLDLQPDATVGASPAGVTADLQLPQNSDPDGLATPPLKDATVTLPTGVSVDPSAANGLQACTDAEADLDSTSPASCPEASDIGTVDIKTPVLPDDLTGQIFLMSPLCNPCTNADAQDGNMLRGFIQASADGVLLKIPGDFTADPTTGQLTAHFDNNPQFPFTDLKLDFKGGSTGMISTPRTCGTFTTNAVFSAWSSPDTPDANALSSFPIDSCPSATTFDPTFVAGSQNPQAGTYSPFSVSFSRSDSDQFFSGLSTTLPPGVVAKLNGVPLCSDADANAGSCPSDTQVGTVETGAGPGSTPYFLPGKAYLTGPYKGAPYGLAVVVPAIAGPYNLGDVIVRQQLQVNPTTAQVTDVSDPFPTILAGIPLQIRRIDVNINRPDFTTTPTNCDPMKVTGVLSSTGGLSSSVSSRYQVGGCSSLAFKPKLKMKLTGKGQTKSGDHPTLTSILTHGSAQANISHVRVALPLNFALDPNNSQVVCPYAIASKVTTGAADCPADTLIGHATAITPLLSQPLTGPVYLVQGLSFAGGVETHTLPTLLIPLRGQIALDLRAQTSVSHGKLVTTFPTIPDAAVSKFTLTINGGKHGILVITGRGRNICSGPQVTQATLSGQSGKATYPNIKMSTPCRVHHATKRRHRK